MFTFASTYRFVTEPELPCEPSVVRVTSVLSAPAVKCQTASAVAVNVPALALLIVTVQLRVLPLPLGVPQVDVSVPGEPVTCGVIDVSEAVEPDGLAFVVIVNTWAVPTSLTPFGVTLTFASTNRFVAAPELPCDESVVRTTSAVAGLAFASASTKCQDAFALAVNVPGVLLLIVTVQVRVLPLPLGTHADCESGAGSTVTLSEFSDAVVPAGRAFVVTVNVCW